MLAQILDEDTPSEQDQGGRSITSSGLDVEKKFQYQLSFVSHSPQVSDIWGLFDRQFGRSDAQEPDPEGRVPQWEKASVQEMKDKFSAIGLGTRQVDLITTFTKLSSLGQQINYEAYTYPVQKVDLSKLKL